MHDFDKPHVVFGIKYLQRSNFLLTLSHAVVYGFLLDPQATVYPVHSTGGPI